MLRKVAGRPAPSVVHSSGFAVKALLHASELLNFLSCSLSCHLERSEQRERSRKISDSFAPAKPVPDSGGREAAPLLTRSQLVIR
jgi:hypothetical protein